MTHPSQFRGNNVIDTQSNIFALMQLKVNFFSHCKHGKEWNHPGQRQGANTLYLVLDGDGELNTPKGRIQLKPGHAYLLPKNDPIGLSCQTGIEKFWSHFSITHHSGLDLLDSYPVVGELGPFSLENSFTRFIESGIHDMEIQFKIRAIHFEMLSRLGTFWERASRLYAQPADKYERLLVHINENLSAALRSNELAEILSITPQSLSRAFKRDMGISLKRYILNQLNERACTLLIGTDMLVKDVAYELGFDDEYHFSRNFTSALGRSPTHYRQAIKGKKMGS